MLKALRAIAAVSAVIFIISAISDISEAVLEAIIRCINIIIPSLFIMMAASRYIIANDMLRPFECLFKLPAKLLGIPPKLLTVFILSNIGGYPIGASMLTQMCKKEQLSQKQAYVIASYCFCSGPAFLIGAVGLCVYGSKEIGALMFISCLTANILFCIIYNRIFGICKIKINDADRNTAAYSLTDAVADSGKALMTMCGIIVAFSVVNVVVGKVCSIVGTEAPLIAAIFEVTNVTEADPFKLELIPFITALTSFGGICVWIQNKALVKNSFPVMKTLLLRIPISVTSGIIFKVLYDCISDQYYSSNADFNGFVVNIDNFVPSICLIIMIFICINKKRLAFQ